MDEKYLELKWKGIFTEGSQVSETAGADFNCKLFSQYAPVGKFMTNFDAEVCAIHFALQNLIFIINNNHFSKVALFIDSSSANQAVSTDHYLKRRY